jgi:LysM repeat protein
MSRIVTLYQEKSMVNQTDPRIQKSSELKEKRVVTSKKTPILATLKTRLREPKQAIALGVFLLALLGIVSFASALTHTVEKGDTLTALAQKYDVSIDEIVAANEIQDANLIITGEQLYIPTDAKQSSSTTTTSSTTTSATSSGLALKAAIDAQLNVPAIAPTAEVNPTVSTGKSCARFNFETGKNKASGSTDGVFVLFDKTGGAVASWYAPAGYTDSGWFNGFNISHSEVHASVVFYPNDGHAVPVLMEIVNPASGSSYGWLARGMCHAMEIQYPS